MLPNTRERDALGARILELMRADSQDMAPSEYMQPVSHYLDPAHLRRERERLFRRMPLLVGASRQFERPGDFRVVEVEGMSFLIARQADDTLKAFHNVCRHRNSKVEVQTSGNRAAFSCPFHAWTYGLDGRLRGIPSEAAFPNVMRSAHGLKAIAIVERHGLVWLGPLIGTEIEIDTFLGAMGEVIDTFEMARASVHRHERLRLKLNWKLVIDTFLEVYHIPHLHKATVGRVAAGDGAVWRSLGPHSHLCTPLKAWLEIGAQAPEASDFSRNIIQMCRIMPNTIVLWVGDHVEIYTVWPDGDDPDRCICDVYLLRPDSPAADIVTFDRHWANLARTTLGEDFPMAETAQKSFHSGVQEHLIFGRNELGLHMFHATLRKTIAD